MSEHLAPLASMVVAFACVVSGDLAAKRRDWGDVIYWLGLAAINLTAAIVNAVLA